MLDPIKKTILYDQNALYYGYGIEKLMEKAGAGIARELVKKYGLGKRIAFICGPGNNGGDGLAAARHLRGRAETVVYLIPSSDKIKTSESKKNWKILKSEKKENVGPKDIPDNFDVIVECLFGTGIQGKLRAPYPAIIKKLNRMRGKKVTIDLPAPGYKADLNISMMFPKAPGAKVVDIGFPRSIAEKTGVGEVKVLERPNLNSHKGDNGRILIVGGSQCYHGAPLLTAQIAGKIVDLVYFSSIPENNALLEKMKLRSAEFISIPRAQVMAQARGMNAILIGPGLDTGDEEKNLTNELLKKYPKKKFVIDADALKIINPKLLNNINIITPHMREFKQLFGVKATRQSIKQMAKKFKTTIVLKGKWDYIAGPQDFKINKTGNAGMTKGGTGDVLAGLITALAAKNDPFLAASAGVFINGLAGDRLARRVASYYSASDLVKEIPKTIKWCLDY